MDINHLTAEYLKRVVPKGKDDASLLYQLITFYEKQTEQHRNGEPKLDGQRRL
jgi:hypothetical protein